MAQIGTTNNKSQNIFLEAQSKCYSLVPNKNYIVGQQKYDCADIKLMGEDIDEKHALVLVNSEGTIALVDLRSRSGTHVNGNRISALDFIALNDNSVVLFGSVKGRFGSREQFISRDVFDETASDDSVADSLSIPETPRVAQNITNPLENLAVLRTSTPFPKNKSMEQHASDQTHWNESLEERLENALTRPQTNNDLNTENNDSATCAERQLLLKNSPEVPLNTLGIPNSNNSLTKGNTNATNGVTILRRSSRNVPVKVFTIKEIGAPVSKNRKRRKRKQPPVSVGEAAHSINEGLTNSAQDKPTTSKTSSKRLKVIGNVDHQEIHDAVPSGSQIIPLNLISEPIANQIGFGSNNGQSCPLEVAAYDAADDYENVIDAIESQRMNEEACSLDTSTEIDLISIMSKISKRRLTGGSLCSTIRQDHLGVFQFDDKQISLFSDNIYLVGRKLEDFDDLFLDVGLDSKLVDEKHAIIEVVENGCIYVIDLRSKYGTFFNGAQARSLVRLPVKDKDNVIFGDKKGYFEINTSETEHNN